MRKNKLFFEKDIFMTTLLFQGSVKVTKMQQKSEELKKVVKCNKNCGIKKCISPRRLAASMVVEPARSLAG